ncbi:hypothetical protein [Acinetobacter bereziniae]|uniref:hypothetical protein n=1 Tax=Acinetobacter bereziniae TaxID=106648 RepID=UPI0021D35157|nr:hypothetical protein [Acinetobacter bereziniae]
MVQLKCSGIALLTIWKLLFHDGKINKVLIYKYKKDLQATKAILHNGIIVKVITHNESDFIYKIHAEKKVILMLDNDYSSYLSFEGKKYFHKGKLNFFSYSTWHLSEYKKLNNLVGIKSIFYERIFSNVFYSHEYNKL